MLRLDVDAVVIALVIEPGKPSTIEDQLDVIDKLPVAILQQAFNGEL